MKASQDAQAAWRGQRLERLGDRLGKMRVQQFTGFGMAEMSHEPRLYLNNRSDLQLT